jgi:protein-disulfide isomerase
VEFGDYECEPTRRAEATLDKVLDRFDGDVRLVFVHLPLRIHDHALLAAQAAEAARLQDRFGPMHEKLLAAKGVVERQDVVRMAREIGLDVARFERDLDGPAKDAVAGMIAFAKAHRLNATPHFAIGDRVVEGAKSEEEFEEAIAGALAEARRRVASGKSRAEVYRESIAFLDE